MKKTNFSKTTLCHMLVYENRKTYFYKNLIKYSCFYHGYDLCLSLFLKCRLANVCPTSNGSTNEASA